ncbi:hypothetical protein BURMUCGD1_0319 [Burkholderia multivorans CGD1]|nr:hypothetical protein BURMUCGD1_0319 [Burkholderia multivorans CGD1]
MRGGRRYSGLHSKPRRASSDIVSRSKARQPSEATCPRRRFRSFFDRRPLSVVPSVTLYLPLPPS